MLSTTKLGPRGHGPPRDSPPLERHTRQSRPCLPRCLIHRRPAPAARCPQRCSHRRSNRCSRHCPRRCCPQRCPQRCAPRCPRCCPQRRPCATAHLKVRSNASGSARGQRAMRALATVGQRLTCARRGRGRRSWRGFETPANKRASGRRAMLSSRSQTGVAGTFAANPAPCRRSPIKCLTDLKGGKMTSGAKFRAGIPSRACGARAFHL